MRANARVRAYYRVFGADRRIAASSRSAVRILDVGCSEGTGSAVLDERAVCGYDIHVPSLTAARLAGRRRPVVCGDLGALPFREGSFDLVVALDVIEHLEKERADACVRELHRVAAADVIVLTPSGFDPQPALPDQPWMAHRSGWRAAELEDAGFAVRGHGGWRRLRRPGSCGRFHLGAIGALFAVLTQPLVARRPDHAFHLLATTPGR